MKPALKRVVFSVPNLLPFAGLLLVISGVIGIFYTQEALQESQEIRSSASGESGQVLIAPLTSPSTTIKGLVQEQVISLGINTQNLPLKEFSVVFNAITDVADTLELVPSNLVGFEVTAETQKTADGFLATAVFTRTSQNFLSNYNQKFLEIHFEPAKAGTIELNFDRELSVALHADNSSDILKHIADATFTIAASEADPTYKACNETCSSNAECQSGFRCFNTGSESRCRLVTNPSSSTCSSESTLKSCNQSCGGSAECQSGLSCINSICRNPNNPESSSCSNPTQQAETQAASCNEACTTNADCAVNFRCYYNQCRLATNPSSTSCSADTTSTVSSLYQKEPVETATPSALPTSPAPETSTENEETPEEFQPEESEPVTQPQEQPLDPDETSLQALLSVLGSSTFRLPSTVLVAGAILLLVGGAVFVAASSRKKPTTVAMTKTGVPPAPPPRETPPPYGAPPQPPSPQTAPPLAPPSQSAPPQAAPPQPVPPPNQSVPMAERSSSMVERLKQKGITPPSTGNQQPKDQ